MSEQILDDQVKNELNTDDNEMEQEILEKGLVAPRVEFSHIKAIADKLEYQVSYHGTTTIVFAIHPNGFKFLPVTLSCVSKENFNEELGRKYGIRKAYTAAVDKLWELEGYRLICNLYTEENK